MKAVQLVDDNHRLAIFVQRLLIVLALILVVIPGKFVSAATYTVTTTADSGPGSLRQAILDANANPGADTITFAIGATGSQQTIQPASALPIITDPVTIDGWSQGGAGYTGPPLIELNGALAGSSIKGLHITAGNSIVRGLVINGFTGTFASGIYLHSGGGNWLYGNYIGTNFAGETRSANQRGVWIEGGSSNNRIGTNADGVNDAAERNVISANIDQNIWIYQPATTGNLIMGNTIGLNAAGTAPIGTSSTTAATTGILVQEASYTTIGTDGDGQGDALEGNVISGNIYNINLTGTSTNRSHHNRVSGNLIGTNASGTASVGIQVEGVRVYVTEDNVIGTDGDGVSDALEGNLISGHFDFGVMLQQTGALNNVVAGNKIGTDITGMNAIANGYGGAPRAGIVVGGYGNRIGTNSDGVSDDLERNLISGNAQTSISAIYFNNLSNPTAPPTIIAGNWLGVDATGLAALPNNYGISGSSAVPVIIRDNVIAANTIDGISSASSGMVIIGNRIGVGADGVTPLGHGQHGINLSGSDNQIGGAGPGEANIIANNGASAAFYNGVLVGNTALRNTIRGNRIYANSRLGIDLRWPDGVNVNDDGDPDTGGNNLQNYPIITFAQGYADGTTVIQGTLNSNPNTTFILDFYYSSEADPTGYGEGEFYLGAASVTTDANGDAEFDVILPVTIPPNQFVTATATHADGSTSEFSLAYAAGGVADVPIQGLAAAHTGSGYSNDPVTFAASITAGTGVSYQWNLGDGNLAAGAFVEHIYTTPGVYTATVSASNNSSSTQAQTVLAVVEAANINGRVWQDLDLDGRLGIGEGGLAGITVSAVGPTGTIQTTTDADGRYQLFTPEPGLYTVSAAAPNMTSITANPIPVPMGDNGGTVVDFGLHETPPAGFGIIAGRAWVDVDGSGFPEPDEEPLAGLQLDYYGFQFLQQTITTDVNGLFSLLLPHERSYVLLMYAPGFFPSERRLGGFNIWLDQDDPLLNYHSPFARGGTVSGRVINSGGAGVPNASLNIAPPYRVTSTDANGDYAFIEQEPSENKGLGINPPFPYVMGSSAGFRVFPLPPNSFMVENWLAERRGRLTVHAQQTIGGQSLPVGSVFFRLQGDSVDQTLVTGLNGQTWADLDAGTYTVTVLPEYLPPNTIVSPTSRTVVVTNNTFGNVTFSVTPAQSLAVECRVGGVGFACTVEIYDANGSLVTTVQLTATAPATVITNLPPGSYEVVIIPAEPGWPENSGVVTLDGDTHAEVNYPFNPSNLQTISGYAYWDRCYPLGVRGNTDYCSETNIPSNNDIPVTLYNAAGTVISTTVTTISTGWTTGYYAFPNLPVGNYRVEINFPGGFVPQTATSAWRNLTGFGSPEYLDFGYTRAENRILTGYAFYDGNNNGSYDVGIDDPHAGAEIAVSTLTGTPIASLTTASDGSFTVLSITSGEYRVEMTTPDLPLTRIAVVPASGSVPWVQFPLPPNDNRPRAIVFVDANQNGQLDPTEQRLGNIGVELYSQLCGGLAAPIETKLTNSDGLALFTNPLTLQATSNSPLTAAAAPGTSPGCVKIVTANLPPNVAPANLNGAAMPKNSGMPVLLPVYAQGTLLVQVFWDVDGDGSHDSNEPFLSSGAATVGGQTKSYSENGATFVLATGNYSLNVVAPAGYEISAALPINVVMGSGVTTRKVAARVAGGINGAVIGPDGAMGGTTVRLTNVATNQTYDTVAATGCAGWCSDAFYQFSNLPIGQYRLSISVLPPGYLLASEPVVNYTVGQNIQQNLMLNPLGYLSGVVYLDDNLNGQRDSGEAAATGYVVSLLNDGGLPVQIATPDANGFYLFTNLNAGVRYLVTVDMYVSQAASASDSLTQAPGWFLPGTQPVQANIGIYQGGSDHNYNTVFGRVTSGGAGVAGIRVGYYQWTPDGGCQPSSPAWQGLETTSDINGDYKLLTNMLPGNSLAYCIAARQLSGYQQSNQPATGTNFSYQTTSGAIFWHPGYWQRDITLVPVGGNAQILSASATAIVHWSAFRDDNLNGAWDDDEPALSGVSVGGDTSGVIIGLGNGAQTLAVVAPAGYAPLHNNTVSVWGNGENVVLPPLAFRFVGALRGQVFADEDGDGWLRRGETGVSDVIINLTGATSASAVTDAQGQFNLPNLPDGDYTVSLTPPAGYAPVSPQTLTLNNGGALVVALRPLAQLSGAVYDDWDGDGRRSADEPLVMTPITVTVAGVGVQRTVLGMFRFWDVADGNYTITPWWLATNSVTVNPATHGGVELPAVPAGEVRGTAWLDGNGDGIRQPWESPLAGVPVTLTGGSLLDEQTVATDAHGRYTFRGLAAGTYTLTPDLPMGLSAQSGSVTVEEGRGAVVGIGVVERSGFWVYLPIVLADGR